MGLDQGARSGSPLDRQKPLNHFLQGAFLGIAGQEHGPVHQALQGLPEQLAGAEAGLQVQEALQH